MTPELPTSLPDLQAELERAVPEYTYEVRNYLLAKTLIVKDTNFRGAAIDLNKKRLAVRYAVPSAWAGALVANFGLLGMLLARAFTKNANEPRDRVADYLQTRYIVAKK